MTLIEFMWKDTNSGGGGCPALYRAAVGYVVQGLKLDDATRVLDRLRELS